MSRLAGQRALVTGAGGGIGGAIVRRLRDEGALVVGCDLAGSDLVCDIADEAAVEQLIAANQPFDVLIHAAALTGGSGRFPDVTTETFDRYLNVNLRGAFLVARAVARSLIAASRGRTRSLALRGIQARAPRPRARHGRRPRPSSHRC